MLLCVRSGSDVGSTWHRLANGTSQVRDGFFDLSTSLMHVCESRSDAQLRFMVPT